MITEWRRRTNIQHFVTPGVSRICENLTNGGQYVKFFDQPVFLITAVRYVLHGKNSTTPPGTARLHFNSTALPASLRCEFQSAFSRLGYAVRNAT